MWPALPGIMPRALFFHHLPDWMALVLMLLIALVFVGLMIYLASLRNWSFVVVAVSVFVLSALNSMFAYALYRA